MENKINTEDISYKSFASLIAGACGLIAGFPFDSMKTRMQTHNYHSLTACVVDTFKYEGIRGFYRGVSPPLITTPVLKSCAFTVYEYTKRLMGPLDRDRVGGYEYTISQNFMAGAAGGISIAFLSAPLDLLKIQMQLHHLNLRTFQKDIVQETTVHSSHLLGRIKSAVAERGVLSVYRGVSAVLFRESLGFGTYFAAYEGICRAVSPTGHKSDIGPYTHFMAGGFSGMIIWLVIFPFDLVQSRLQREALSQKQAYTGVLDCVKKTFHESGLLGFYSGIRPSLIRAFPVHAIIFVVYEYLLKLKQEKH